MTNDELSPPLPLPKEGRFVVGPVAGGLRFAHPRLYSVALVPGGFATGAFAGLDYPLARQAQIRVLRDKETEETKGHLRAPTCYLSLSCLSFQK